MDYTGRLLVKKNKSKVLYTAFDIEKCKERFNDDINSYGGRNFSGKIYNNDFYIVYATNGRYRTEYEFRANLRQEGGFTRIQYEFSGFLTEKKHFVFLALFPLVLTIFALIVDYQNYQEMQNIWFYVALFYGFTICIFLPLILITNYFYRQKLVKFVEIMSRFLNE